MKILVCGGRNFHDISLLNRALSAAKVKHGAFCVVHGDARGADRMAGKWGKDNGHPVVSVPANWDFYDQRAGPIRNQWMLDFTQPDAVIAFPGGTGTRDMCSRSEKAGIPVWRVK